MADPSQQSILKIPRAIVLDLVVPLSAGGAGVAGVPTPINLQIPSDADFEWWFLSIFRTNSQLKLQIDEGGTGTRKMIQQGIQSSSAAFYGILVDNMAGLVASNGAFPIAVPYVMPATRVYVHTLTDFSGANNTFEAAYHGFALLSVPGS